MEQQHILTENTILRLIGIGDYFITAKYETDKFIMMWAVPVSVSLKDKEINFDFNKSNAFMNVEK